MVMIEAGMRIAVIHAPSLNFPTRTRSRVTPVAKAPTPLMVMRRIESSPPCRFQCIAMPTWESVKARKAPMGKERDQAIADAAEDD
jgi:hypothetical protein